MYNPDLWAVIKINGPKPHYRVAASWRGGYLNGDSWRLNSGITSVTENGDYLEFHGSSGSTYNCYKKAYGMSSLTASVIANLQQKQPDINIEVLPEDTNFLELVYE